jgi:hypothetical protein
MMNISKKYPVRDYRSVETGIFRHTRHAVGMTPLSDASLRDAGVGQRCFSTERYIPEACSLMTATGRRPVETRLIASLQYTNNHKQQTIND